jgi:putative (di)nucleoside polyphosphate hydrolase
MPQGGVDDGEDLDTAMLRELGEETGIGPRHLQIVQRMEGELLYDLPPELQGKLWGGRFRGQRQSWYLVRFTGAESDIDLAAHRHPEFCEYKWVDPELLPVLIVPFKQPVYEAVLAAFRPWL